MTTYSTPRSHPRASFSHTVRVRPPAWVPVEAVGIDLSRGGICVSTPLQLTPGDHATVQITPQSIPHVELDAEVRWVKPDVRSPGDYFVGMRWQDMDDARAQLLAGLVQASFTLAPAAKSN